MQTLTQKERTLLEDQKQHEQICIQKYTNYANQASDAQLKQIFNANAQSERTHLDTINQLLNGSIPQMNQQQNQGSGQQASGQGQQAMGQNPNQQPTGQAMGQQAANTQGSFSDKDMCTDVLMTEKYVSGAYNTAIFEFRDPQVRDVLNHIQKEEQKHGESVFKYMESKGMYNQQ